MAKRNFAKAHLYTLARLEPALARAYAKELKRFRKQAAKHYADNGAVSSFVLEQHRGEMMALLSNAYRATIPPFANIGRNQVPKRKKAFEIEWDVFLRDLINAYINKRALDKAATIAATDYADVIDAIETGIAEGQGAETVARNIAKVTKSDLYRAATIARTETAQAANYGSIESVRYESERLGIQMRKKWVPVEDARTRPEHAAMADAESIPMDEQFLVGGEYLDFPATGSIPENNINCRCLLIYEEVTDGI